MNVIFNCSYPLDQQRDAHFAVTESEDGAIGVASDGAWIRIPFQAYQQLHDILRDFSTKGTFGDPCAANGPSPLPLPANVRQLVIAAREVWEDADDNDKLFRLDKALEPFAGKVPYANEPDRKGEIAEALANPKSTASEGWHCGNRSLQSQFAVAMIVAGKACARDTEDLEYLAEHAGPKFTRAAIPRLFPGAPVEEIEDNDLPF